jgi:hypothetical protein
MTIFMNSCVYFSQDELGVFSKEKGSCTNGSEEEKEEQEKEVRYNFSK